MGKSPTVLLGHWHDVLGLQRKFFLLNFRISDVA